MSEIQRKVVLRDERSAAGSRGLWAHLDGAGNLRIEGQDLGPATAPVSHDGEYEWFETIQAADLPRLVELLGGGAGNDPLDLLESGWTGSRSHELERIIRSSGISVDRHIC